MISDLEEYSPTKLDDKTVKILIVDDNDFNIFSL
jgi:hypothetical protein